jgi:hypothetical protein
MMDHDCNSFFGILLVAGCCCFPAVFFPNGNLESMSAAYNPIAANPVDYNLCLEFLRGHETCGFQVSGQLHM